MWFTRYSLFDYVSNFAPPHGQYPPPPPPLDAIKSPCITLDTEADFLDPTGRIRLFDDDALFNRYVSIIKKYNIKVTSYFFIMLT